MKPIVDHLNDFIWKKKQLPRIQAILFMVLSMRCMDVNAQIHKPIYGKIVRYNNFASKFVPARNVDVWIPDDYNNRKKYAVMYMHDGEMLFDSSLTWNKQSWHADRAVYELRQKKGMKDCIIVGIWNGGKNRHAEYCPQKPFESLSKPFRDSLILYSKRSNGTQILTTNVYSDDYLKFIVKELKPFIDSNYSTHPDRKNTFISGSSMGGLISIYAICEYPEIFGG
ncbi:MAG: alpha/beta hydrolase, partial [Ferruginibacter sp.]|nr:alpha/beta hydrolase [Ferruginibacter sp.]